MKTPYIIFGSEAIRLAQRDQLQIQCNASSLDYEISVRYGIWPPGNPDGGGPVDLATARLICKDDPGLIFVRVKPHTPSGWWNGKQPVAEMPGYNVSDYFGASGVYLGPDGGGIEPIWDNYDT